MKINENQFNKKKSFLHRTLNINRVLAQTTTTKIQTFFVSLISIQTQQHIKKKGRKIPPTFFTQTQIQKKKEPNNCIQQIQQQQKNEYNFCEG